MVLLTIPLQRDCDGAEIRHRSLLFLALRGDSELFSADKGEPEKESRHYRNRAHQSEQEPRHPAPGGSKGAKGEPSE